MTVWYLPLEPYRERYTEQLLDWTEARLKARGVAFRTIYGEPGAGTIATGTVLDAYRRSEWSLTQTTALVGLLAAGAVEPGDAILLHDFFHPGFEALPYIFDQLPPGRRPRVYAQNWAQSVDPNDFTFPMRRWMRHYELMADANLDAIFCASSCHADMMRACLYERPIHVVGLPFDKDAVRAQAGPIPALADRPRKVVYTSRLDREKQPHFFLNLVVASAEATSPPIEFVICTGSDRLRSNDPTAVARAESLHAAGRLRIAAGLTKEAYYAELKTARAQFNCALQDFVSYTMLEASALGTPSVLPAHLSFPEAVANDARFLYCPWSLDSAIDRLDATLDEPPPGAAIGRSADYHHGALDRTIDILAPGAR